MYSYLEGVGGGRAEDVAKWAKGDVNRIRTPQIDGERACRQIGQNNTTKQIEPGGREGGRDSEGDR